MPMHGCYMLILLRNNSDTVLNKEIRLRADCVKLWLGYILLPVSAVSHVTWDHGYQPEVLLHVFRVFSNSAFGSGS